MTNFGPPMANNFNHQPNHFPNHHSGPADSQGICAVCGDHADGHHYGVLSCRGCNAFFRRAVTFNLQFHCRREGHCEINKNARCACRACRLQKCQAVGMDRSAVQVRREMKDVLALDTHHDYPDPFSVDDHSPGHQSDHFPTSSVVLGSARLLDMPGTKSCLLGSTTSSSLAPSSPLAMLHPLDRLVQWYFCQRYRRQTMLCQTVEQVLAGIGADGRKPICRLTNAASAEDLCQVNKVQAVLMFEWVHQLEEFGQLEDPEDKTLLLRSFSVPYLFLDILLHTLECGSTDRLVLPNSAFVFPGDCPFVDVVEERRAMELLYSDFVAGSVIHSLLPQLLALAPTFGEFMALRLLLLWHCSPSQSPHCATVARAAAERARRELREWLELHALGGGERVETLVEHTVPLIRQFADNFGRVSAMLPEFCVMPEWQFMADLQAEPRN